MRIKRIHLKNIHSLKGEHSLDLTAEPISSSGIFLITGPTGSGKSTLLDVISLALFNQVPRADKKLTTSNVEAQGMLLTRGTQDAYAEVEYECQAGVFISKWQIGTKRTGRLQEYHMELAREDGTVMDLKKSEVPAMNEELIGLNYEQLTRSMILAQGQFAKFLRSHRDEKGRLLERITGTHIYREIGKRIFEENREIASRLKDLQTREAQEKEQLISSEEEEALSGTFAKLQGDQKDLEEKLSKQQTKLNELERFIKLNKELAEADAKLKHAQEAFKSFQNESGPKVKAHRKLIPFLESFSTLDDKERELAKTFADLETHEEERTKLVQRQAEVTSEISDLLKQVSLDPMEDLNKFQKKVELLQKKVEDIRSEFKLTYSQLQHVTEGLPVAEGSMESPTSPEVFKDAMTSTSQQVKDLRDALKLDDRTDLEEFKSQLMQNLEHVHQLAKYTSDTERLTRLISDSEKQYSSLQEETKALPSAIALLKSEQENLDLKILNAQKEKEILSLHQQFGELLKDGEECPMCGSLEHPHAHKVEEGKGAQVHQEIESLNKARKEKASELAKAEAKLDSLHKEQQKLQTQTSAFRKELDSVKEHESAVRSGLPEYIRSIDADKAGQLVQDMLHQMETLGRLTENLNKLEKSIPLASTIQECMEKGQLAAQELREVYQGPDIATVADDIKSRYRSISGSLETVTKRIESDKAKAKQLGDDVHQYREQLEAELAQKNMDKLAQCRSRVLLPSQYDALSNQESELTRVLTQWQDRLQAIQEQLSSIDVDSDTDMDKLRSDIIELKNNLERVHNESRTVFSKLQAQKNRKEEINRLQKEQEQITKGHLGITLLNKYLGDAQGKRFANYAQELTLRHLLHLANERLEMLNKRYQLRHPESEQEDIEVIDMDMGMMRRSVRTLSGGETFQVSLALALGLSDLAARHVEIDCLFIDEGFGTLDPETLDQTLATLEKLQAQTSKMIGLISHVGELKERLNVKINMIPDGMGMSRIAIEG